VSPPLEGFADTHTHPLSNLAFGGALAGASAEFPQGPPGGLVWGDAAEDDISVALAACDADSHLGHNHILGFDLWIPTLGQTNLSEQVVLSTGRQGGARHGRFGYSAASAPASFTSWPDWRDGLHQQYHAATMIRRAYDHGLRLMCALAVHTRLFSRMLLGEQGEQFDEEAIDLEISGIKAMIASHSWMELALTPADVREIVGVRDHLAIVLGVEVDQLDRYGGDAQQPRPGADVQAYTLGQGRSVAVIDDPANSWVPQLLDKLVELGIRQITPLHFADNAFGGFAVYGDLFNSSNNYSTGKFAEVVAAVPDAQPGASPPQPGDPTPDGIDFHFDPQEQTQIQFPLGDIVPVPASVPSPASYKAPVPLTPYGHKNARGLTYAGYVFIREAMKRGLVIDVDHMSDRTINGYVDPSSNKPVAGVLDIVNKGVDGSGEAYPVLSSHTAVRSLQYRSTDPLAWAPNSATGGAPMRVCMTSERSFSDETLSAIAAQGMLAPGTADPGSVNVAHVTGLAPGIRQRDIPKSSLLSWAANYLAAVEAGGGPDHARVALGTDFTLTPSCGPRFGRRIGPRPGPPGYREPLSGRLPYAGEQSGTLERSKVGERVYDFNSDGLAHHGLLADLLTDLRSVIDDTYLAPLLNSAEAYTGMWERCRAAAGLP